MAQIDLAEFPEVFITLVVYKINAYSDLAFSGRLRSQGKHSRTVARGQAVYSKARQPPMIRSPQSIVVSFPTTCHRRRGWRCRQRRRHRFVYLLRCCDSNSHTSCMIRAIETSQSVLFKSVPNDIVSTLESCHFFRM